MKKVLFFVSIFLMGCTQKPQSKCFQTLSLEFIDYWDFNTTTVLNKIIEYRKLKMGTGFKQSFQENNIREQLVEKINCTPMGFKNIKILEKYASGCCLETYVWSDKTELYLVRKVEPDKIKIVRPSFSNEKEPYDESMRLMPFFEEKTMDNCIEGVTIFSEITIDKFGYCLSSVKMYIY